MTICNICNVCGFDNNTVCRAHRQELLTCKVCGKRASKRQENKDGCGDEANKENRGELYSRR